MPKVSANYIKKEMFVGMKFPAEEVARIDEYARRSGRSRSAEVRYRLNEIYNAIEKEQAKV